MILIFAVDENWHIGFDGGMLTEIREDLKRFKELTENNIVIMGRRTLEAIPGQRPLENRINILLSRNEKFKDKGFILIDDLSKLGPLLEEINPNGYKKVFLTGGESLVRQLFPYCKKAYITKILRKFPQADTSIPNLDLDKDWVISYESDLHYQGDLKYKYVNYERIGEDGDGV